MEEALYTLYSEDQVVGKSTKIETVKMLVEAIVQKYFGERVFHFVIVRENMDEEKTCDNCKNAWVDCAPRDDRSCFSWEEKEVEQR